MATPKVQSLKSFFRGVAIKWSLASLLFISLFAIPSLILGIKTASERHVMAEARNAAIVFRNSILGGTAREVEPQIKKALRLKGGEDVVIRDESLGAIYFDGTKRDASSCTTGRGACWENGYSKVRWLEPIYFSENGILKGYLDLTLKPFFDNTWLLALLVVLPLIFLIQVIGLNWALNNSRNILTKRLSEWAAQIEGLDSRSILEPSAAPFEELSRMQLAVDGMQGQISQLKEQTAKDVKQAAQISIINEIGHDLQTPLSQLAKFWALHLDTVRSHNQIDESEVTDINRTLKRMGGVIRQIRAAHRVQKSSEPPFVLDPAQEIGLIIRDLRVALALNENSLQWVGPTGPLDAIKITNTEFFQIIDNLVRNAVEAVKETPPQIVISLDDKNGFTILQVTDNGQGIPEIIKNRIFDYDFTQKPSKGMGLGLGIVRRICSDYGAKLSFSSQDGIGTTFQIVFQTHIHEEVYNAVQTLNS